MIGIYNTITLDGQDTGKVTTLTATAVDQKLLAIYNSKTGSKITSFKVRKIRASQASTPDPDNYVAITAKSAIYYRRATTSSGTGTQYSRGMPRVMYDGDYDIKTGAYVDRCNSLVLRSSQAWEIYNSGYSSRSFRAPISDMGTGSDTTAFLCTHAVYNGSSSHEFGTFRYSSGYVYFQDQNSRFADVDAFKAWLETEYSASRAVKIIYPLATPVTGTGSISSPTFSDTDNYYWTSDGLLTVVYVDHKIELKRPNDFVIEREEIYAGEYTTCTGATKADRIGWKYADIDLSFDELTEQELNILTGMRGELLLKFMDSDGEHTESVIRSGFANTPTRFTLPDSSVIWKDCVVSLRFINAYN